MLESIRRRLPRNNERLRREVRVGVVVIACLGGAGLYAYKNVEPMYDDIKSDVRFIGKALGYTPAQDESLSMAIGLASTACAAEAGSPGISGVGLDRHDEDTRIVYLHYEGNEETDIAAMEACLHEAMDNSQIDVQRQPDPNGFLPW